MILPTGRRSNSLRDKGLQPERTALAWRRTGLACILAGALSFHVALYAPLTGLVGGLALTAAGAAVIHLVAPQAPTEVRLGRRRFVAATLLLLGLAVGAVAVIAFAATRLASAG